MDRDPCRPGIPRGQATVAICRHQANGNDESASQDSTPRASYITSSSWATPAPAPWVGQGCDARRGREALAEPASALNRGRFQRRLHQLPPKTRFRVAVRREDTPYVATWKND